MNSIFKISLWGLTMTLWTSAIATTSPAEFTLSAQATAWTLGATQSASTTLRLAGLDPASDPVRFTLEGVLAGAGRDKISAAFGPLKSSESALKLNVGADVPIGTYSLSVRASSGTVSTTLPLRVKVERWLLVDADRSENNRNVTESHRPDPKAKDSALDTAMKNALNGRIYDVFAVKQGSMTTDLSSIGGPAIGTLRKYSGVVWYTGNQDYQVPIEQDYANLRSFLDEDSRRLVMFSPAMVLNMAGAGNVFQTTEKDPQDNQLLTQQKDFLKNVFGVSGYHGYYARDSYMLTPVAGTPVTPFGRIEASGGNSVRVAFKALEHKSVRSWMTAPVQDQRNVISTGSIVLGRGGIGQAQTSSGLFIGVSPDALKTPNLPALLRTFLLF
ncbi:hypothetical protein [Deinococcus humi]|uniref:CARDB domain-containing protein n=1 Tax=Deinococcus humi TaxID=662880 RepID=A0A7W8JV46_9DEIO|nr:hypothetical protein [Deinococcus humi]MBB5363777.1 hypothetical protein [Deinococcus humi]GGO32041.1 hypothetical protein GCM10008949_28940 [Deinococcus humi]